jgi:hypothetical protein
LKYFQSTKNLAETLRNEILNKENTLRVSDKKNKTICWPHSIYLIWWIMLTLNRSCTNELVNLVENNQSWKCLHYIRACQGNNFLWIKKAQLDIKELQISIEGSKLQKTPLNMTEENAVSVIFSHLYWAS